MKSRELTGVGFFTDLEVPPNVPRVTPPHHYLRFGDVHAVRSGLKRGAGFLIFVDDGVLTTLEGYSFEEAWPRHPVVRSLVYGSDPRDLSRLA